MIELNQAGFAGKVDHLHSQMQALTAPGTYSVGGDDGFTNVTIRYWGGVLTEAQVQTVIDTAHTQYLTLSGPATFQVAVDPDAPDAPAGTVTCTASKVSFAGTVSFAVTEPSGTVVNADVVAVAGVASLELVASSAGVYAIEASAVDYGSDAISMEAVE